MADLELDDIQGILLSGYGHLPESAYLFLALDDPARGRSWLGRLANRVTTADWRAEGGGRRKPDRGINVAVSAAGLRALGLPPGSLDTFPQEFVEGMARPPRPRRLGDTGSSDPGRWEFGGTAAPTADEIHALLILQAPDRDALDRLCDEHAGGLHAAGIREVVLPRHYGRQERGFRDHFGYHDSISQPAIEGSPNRRAANRPGVRAGEFVLGYANEYGALPQGPTVAAADDPAGLLQPYEQEGDGPQPRDLGRNGSYLVCRKLAQDVAAFRRFLRDNTPGGTAAGMEHLAAKLMGRWPGGAPLALSPAADDPALASANDFGYAAEDPNGLLCPMGAHLRRCNPRDQLIGTAAESQAVTNRHRLIRRGVSYGPRLAEGAFEDDGQARGLLFLAINANIERQFEFVQQTWANSPKFGGAYTDSDPIIGTNFDPGDPGDEGPWTMTIPGLPVRRRIAAVPRCVTTVGGGYFFLPSVAALRYLAGLGG